MRYSSLHVANKIIDLAHEKKEEIPPLKLMGLVLLIFTNNWNFCGFSVLAGWKGIY